MRGLVLARRGPRGEGALVRRDVYRSTPEAALALFARAPILHLAASLPGEPEAAPLLRVVHPVVVDGAIHFHSADAGEKTLALGARCVATAHEVVASIPSYFIDPERACPATTLYRSAMAHGRLAAVDDPDRKAEVLRALLAKLQPEGGHVPIEAGHRLYAGAIRSLLVVRLEVERMEAKDKLAQNRTPADRARLLERLWGRGAPGDVEAIELVRRASPSDPAPGFLALPAPLEACVAPGAADAAAAARLLAGTYWNGGFSEAELAAAHLGSSAWVAARAGGELVASARAVSDGAKRAWIYDVVVAPELRGRGVASALLRLLLEHPRLRAARTVQLGTRDAQPLYARLGFTEDARIPRGDYTSTLMTLARSPAR